MSFYEHTFVGKQDISDKDVNSIIDVCTKIIKKSGKLLKTEKWGLLNLPRRIKNIKKAYLSTLNLSQIVKLLAILKKNFRLKIK